MSMCYRFQDALVVCFVRGCMSSGAVCPSQPCLQLHRDTDLPRDEITVVDVIVVSAVLTNLEFQLAHARAWTGVARTTVCGPI